MDLQAMLYSLAVIYWHHDSMQTPHSFFKQYCEVTLFQLSHPLQAIVFLPRVLFFPPACFHSNPICLEASCQVSKLSTEMNKEAFRLLLFNSRVSQQTAW